MLGADELRRLAAGFRNEPKSHTDDALVELIESEVARYRAILAAGPEQLPSAPLDALLPLMGWLIYETSWYSVQQIVSGFDRLDLTDDKRVRSEAALDQVVRLADAARKLPWPEFAPRALGAVRSQALAESKRDTPEGYDAAWLLHEEGKIRYRQYRESHGDKPGREDFVLALDEVLLQLALAETGTACRTAERVIGRWAEEFALPEDPADPDGPDRSREREEQWILRMFRQLTDGVEVGQLALDRADWIEQTHRFTKVADEKRLALPTARQNPGIMTARAAVLLLALGPEMARLGQRPEAFETWPEWELDVLDRFTQAYRAIEKDRDTDGEPIPMRKEFQRQFLHLRLDLALLKPGYSLPSAASFAPCLERDPLDAAAVEELSRWLADTSDGRNWRGFGAATMPSFIRSVTACRDLGPDDEGYQTWRREWFEFEAYAAEPGRRENVEKALAAAR